MPATEMLDQQENDGAAHVEGLRAWLREVDRTIGIRSRVGIALIAFALTGTGVAIYLGVEASRQGPSSAEVQALRGEIQALGGQAARAATRLDAGLALARSRAGRSDAETAELQSQVQSLRWQASAAPGAKPSQGVQPASASAASKGSVAGAEGSAGPASRAGKSSGDKGTAISAAENPKLGKIIVNSQGLTLYEFQKDKGARSACYGSCASVWPPLRTSGEPAAMQGVEASKLGTAPRTDATTQVTYGGHPLYTYVGDRRPGDVRGNAITEFGGSWHALRSSGARARG